MKNKPVKFKIDSTCIKQAGALRHTKLMQAAIDSCRDEFLHEFSRIFPYLPQPELTYAGIIEPRTYSKDLHGSFDIYNYEAGEACDLSHPKAYVTEDRVSLTLEAKRTINHITLTLNWSLFALLSPEDILALRQCGAMREVTEHYNNSTTRTIVQCGV